jgi:hypothetical protein
MSDAERRKLYDTHVGEVVTCVSLDPSWRDILSFSPEGQRFAIVPGGLFREGVRLAMLQHALRFSAFKDFTPEIGECFCVESAEFPDIRMRSVVLDRIEGLGEDAAASQGEGDESRAGITEVEAIGRAEHFLESNGHTVVPTDYRGAVDPGQPPLCCCGSAWSEDHWTVLFAPYPPEGEEPEDMPLVLVQVDDLTGEARFVNVELS